MISKWSWRPVGMWAGCICVCPHVHRASRLALRECCTYYVNPRTQTGTPTGLVKAPYKWRFRSIGLIPNIELRHGYHGILSIDFGLTCSTLFSMAPH
jgi:hypothetical protein